MIILLAKITLALGAAIAVSAGARRASAAWRHWMLASGLACALLLPLMAVVAPRWGVSPARRPTPPATVAVTTVVELPSTPAASPDVAAARWPTVPRLLTAIWIAGVALMAIPLIVSLLRLRAIAARGTVAPDNWLTQGTVLARSLKLRRAVAFRITDRPGLLVTWGWQRPEILLPPDAGSWAESRIRMVAAHELAHVARQDWPLFVLADTVRVVYWFHPLAWIASRRLKFESERACDDTVLAMGTAAPDYAETLVSIARTFASAHVPASACPAIVRPSILQRRVSAMLNVSLDRRPMSVMSRALCVALVAVAAVPLAGYGLQDPGTFSGSVSDPSGAAVSSVPVTLSSATLNLSVETKTDGSGHFSVPVIPGDYQIDVKKPGFQPYTANVTIASGGRVDRPIALTLGTLQETIVLRQGPADFKTKPDITPAPARAASIPARACTASGSGGEIVPPMKVKDVHPIFPAGVTLDAESVVVPLKATIGTDGRVQDVVATAEVPAALEASAITAVRAWEFTPTLLNCVPTEVSMNVSVTFQGAR